MITCLGSNHPSVTVKCPQVCNTTYCADEPTLHYCHHVMSRSWYNSIFIQWLDNTKHKQTNPWEKKPNTCAELETDPQKGADERVVLPNSGSWDYSEEICCVLVIIFPTITQIVMGTQQISKNTEFAAVLRKTTNILGNLIKTQKFPLTWKTLFNRASNLTLNTYTHIQFLL